MSILLQTKQLEPNKKYDLDFDNQFITCDKYDAKKSYKMKHGYFQGVATIGKNIIHLENRNGNSNVKFKQEETLEEVYKLLNDNGIKNNRSSMDCGSFTKEVIKTAEKNSDNFFTRAQRCGELTNQIHATSNWTKVTIGFKEIEVASI